MKTKKILPIILFSLLLASCDSGEESNNNSNTTIDENMEDSKHTNTQVDENNTSNNLITLDNTISGQWIDFSGELVDHQDYITTDFITYSSSEDYFISHNSYVSYFDSEKNHIKTIRHDADDALEKYSDASLIRISFNQDRKDYIKITN